MKKSSAALAAFAVLTAFAGEVSPLLSGFHPDPSVTRGADGAYYLVTSTFMWNPGIPVYRSDDFRSWSRVGHALPDIASVIEPGDEFTDDDGVWAPTIRFHGGTYYVVFAFHGREFRNYLTTARDPAGPWTKPVHVKAADGGIDPSLFFDDDGKVYWTATMPARKPNREGHIEIYVQEIDLASGQLVGRREYITDGVFPGAQWAEGPHIYKKDGVYRLVIAEGGTGFNHAATALKSKSVWGPYLPQKSNPLVTRRDRGNASPLQATGHSDIVEALLPVICGLRSRHKRGPDIERRHFGNSESFLQQGSKDRVQKFLSVFLLLLFVKELAAGIRFFNLIRDAINCTLIDLNLPEDSVKAHHRIMAGIEQIVEQQELSGNCS